MGIIQDKFTIARKRMIKEQLQTRGISNEKLLSVMAKIPRHIFVDEALKSQSYMDAPLNIGEGQTISQPYIVALMISLLELKGHERVLEIGTGCGYQTSILSALAGQVYSIERIRKLTMQARKRLKQLQKQNIILRVGDGSLGWKDTKPFDRIIVSCAMPNLAESLLDQLTEDGYIIAPVSKDSEAAEQELYKIYKHDNKVEKISYGECRFVKMIGKNGYDN